MICEKTTTPIEVIDRAAGGNLSGIVHHRVQVVKLSSGIYLATDPTLSTFITMTSDTCLDYARKGADYTIIFQGAKCYAVSQLGQMAFAGDDIGGSWGLVIGCIGGCTKLVKDEDYRLGHPPSYPGLDIGIRRHIEFQDHFH